VGVTEDESGGLAVAADMADLTRAEEIRLRPGNPTRLSETCRHFSDTRSLTGFERFALLSLSARITYFPSQLRQHLPIAVRNLDR
jgi:hypothetical protein